MANSDFKLKKILFFIVPKLRCYCNQDKKSIVIAAWIAGIQEPWMVTDKHIHVSWIAAIPAEMTA